MCADTNECSDMDGKLGDISVSQDNRKTRYDVMHFANKATEKDKRSRIVEKKTQRPVSSQLTHMYQT